MSPPIEPSPPPLPSTAPPHPEVARLLGSWRLQHWHSQTADGQLHHPFGLDALGVLTYSLSSTDEPGGGWDGRMSAQLSKRQRPTFAAPHLSQQRKEERAAAFDSYVAYAGRFRFADGCVVHLVEQSLFPGWVGSELVRRVSWRGDLLVLSTVPAPGESRSPAQHELAWRRG